MEKREVKRKPFQGHQTYDIPRIRTSSIFKSPTDKKQQLSSGTLSQGLFVSEGGIIYSPFYEELEISEKQYQTLLSKIPVPKPRGYSTFNDYENALKQWELKMNKALGSLLLPEVLGRTYPRPSLYITDIAEMEDSITQHNTGQERGNDDLSSKEFEFSASGETASESTLETASGKGIKSARGSSQNPRIPESTYADTDESSRSPGSSAKEPRNGGLLVEESSCVVIPPLVVGYDSERWESVLIPVEPNPNWYRNYEDYSQAMVRWSGVVSETVKFIPPKSEQLNKLLPIAVLSEQGNSENDRWIPHDNHVIQRKWVLPNYPFFPNDIKIEIITPSAGEITKTYKTDVSPAVWETFEKYFNLLYNIQNRCLVRQGSGKYTIYVHDNYGDTHASIVPPNHMFSTTEGESKLGVTYFRRKAMVSVEKEKEERPNVGDKIRSVPVFDITFNEETITNPEELKKAKSDYITLLYRYRNHDMYGWYNPSLTVAPKVFYHDIERHTNEIKSIMDKKENFTLEDIVNVVSVDCNLDVFFSAIEPDSGASNFHSTMKKFDFNMLPELFRLIHETHQRRLHFRLALIVYESLKHPSLAPLIVSSVLKSSISTIGVLSVLTHAFDSVERDIFPYEPDNLILMKKVLMAILKSYKMDQIDNNKQSSTTDPTVLKDYDKFCLKYWPKMSVVIKAYLDDDIGPCKVVFSSPARSPDGSPKTTYVIGNSKPEEFSFDIFKRLENENFQNDLRKLWFSEGFSVQSEVTVIPGSRPDLNSTIYTFKFYESKKIVSFNELEEKEKEKEFDNLLDKFYRWYYITETRIALKSTKFVEASASFTKETKIIAKEIMTIFKKEPLFLTLSIKLIGHKSKLVSSLFLFFMIQLIKSPDIAPHILDPRLKLYSQFKLLSAIPYRHVKTATNRIWESIAVYQLDDFKRYLKYNYLFISCLIQDVPILSNVIVNIITEDLKKWNEGVTDPIEPNPTKGDVNYSREKMTYGWWIDDTAISQLINHLKNNEYAVVNVVKVLYNFIKTFSLEKYKDYVSDKETKKESKKTEKSVIPIKIEKEQVLQIFQTFAQVSQFPNKNYREVLLLTYLLKTLRHFIKLPDYFSYLNHVNLNVFISAILDHPDHDLNIAAWKTIYSIIKYNPNIVEQWVDDGRQDGKLMKNFLDPLNIRSLPITLENCFRYITKLLSMPPRNTKKGKDKRSVESDTKLIVMHFINQRVFTHVHMIHQNLNKKSPGPAFHTFIKFYHLLLTEPALSKLLKDSLKHTQWKVDIDEAAALLGLSTDKQVSSKKLAKEKPVWE